MTPGAPPMPSPERQTRAGRGVYICCRAVQKRTGFWYLLNPGQQWPQDQPPTVVAASCDTPFDWPDRFDSGGRRQDLRRGLQPPLEHLERSAAVLPRVGVKWLVLNADRPAVADLLELGHTVPHGGNPFTIPAGI